MIHRPTTNLTSNHVTPFAAGVLGVSFLLLLHRYPGIRHDSILYMGQALAAFQPDAFVDDLFFLHGNQDRYSIFPWVLGKLLHFFSLPEIFLWGSLISLLLFSWSSWFALRAMLPERQRYWAWLGVLCLPSIYGMVHIFSFNEPFLTSRPYSESFCLLALGLFARKNTWLAIACLSIACLLHPLQALAATLIIWVRLTLDDHRWWHALWAILPVLLIATLGFAPFDGLLHRTSPEWLKQLKHSQQLYLLLWSGQDIRALAVDSILLILGWRSLQVANLSRWCLAGLIGMSLGFLGSLVLVDGLHLVLPTSLQLWRVQWLAHWLAMAALSSLLIQHIRENAWPRSVLLLACAILAWGESSTAFLGALAIYLALPRLEHHLRPGLARMVHAAIALALLLLFWHHFSTAWETFSTSGYRLSLFPLDISLLKFPALALGLLLAATFLWRRSAHSRRIAIVAFGLLPLTGWAALRWDARTPLDIAFEQASNRPDIFGITLPEHSQIYWEPESLVASWLVTHRASYFSNGQMSGQMFNRATAIDGRNRAIRLFPLSRAVQTCRSLQQISCLIPDAAFMQACNPGNPAPPDYLAIPYSAHLTAAGKWAIQNPNTKTALGTYWLYDCKQIRQLLQTPRTTQPHAY